MLDFLTNIPAAGWAAIAAGLSAVSALMMLKVQRRNLFESVKPELIIEGWDRKVRSVEHDHEVLTFKAIRNVGKGPALHVFASSSAKGEDLPVGIMNLIRVPIIAPCETHEAIGEIELRWKNVESTEGFKYVSVDVTILAWDSHHRRHETVYNLLVDHGEHGITSGSDIAPNVTLTDRRVRVRRPWTLRLEGRLKRLTKMPRQGLKSIQNKLLPRSKS